MRTGVSRACGLGTLIIFLATAAGAQIPIGGNVFVGYSYARGDAFTGSTTPAVIAPSGKISMNGWEGSVEGKYLPWIGLVADLDWHYGGREFSVCSVPSPCPVKRTRVNASRHTLVFGPRASISIGRYTPFAEFLVGFAHQSDAGGSISNSDLSFATAVGGGLDYKLIKGVAWRVQGESISTRLFGGTQRNLRLSTGVVFRF